jgi:hypothetical protein
MNFKNIALLCRFMEGLNDPRFTMQQWTHNCDTPACALGWACTIPELQAQGLSLHRLAKEHAAVEMIHKVFGNEFEVYWTLFSGGGNTLIKTPQQWVAKCRAFLKEHGHVVAPPDEEFKRFMDALMTPLPEEKLHVPS